MRLLHFLLLFIFLLPLAQAESQGCSKKVMFGDLDWDSSRFLVQTARFVLEEGYGCETDSIPGSTLPLTTALAKGDVDLLMEVWVNSIQETWDKFLAREQVVTAGVSIPNATQAFWVPTYLVEGDPERGIEPLAPDLKTVQDLIRYKHLFQDPEVPSKGRFYNCILGWSCEHLNSKKLHAYGLLDHFTNFRPGTGAALSAAMNAKYNKGEPFVAYYWGPTWVLGTLNLTKIEEPPFDPALWKTFLREEKPKRATAYPITRVNIGANADFAKNHPQIIEFLERFSVTSEQVSEALAFMQKDKSRTPEDAAIMFLKSHEKLWKEWVTPDAALKIEKALMVKRRSQGGATLNFSEEINQGVNYIVREYGSVFEEMVVPIRKGILYLEALLTWFPWWLLALLSSALMLLTDKKMLFLLVFFSYTMIYLLGLWSMALQTLALMIIASLVSMLVGIPLGILSSSYDRLRSFMLPILDGMQTMPSFVYLIPALMLFGLGKVPAVFATVIYAVAPIIRLTDLGLREVDAQVLEAARSFGSSYRQILFRVKLPLALPTIMAGINQATMLALSMVVIASMIGARGLGEQVLMGIQKLDVGKGFTAGLGIVFLAIILDRITQGLGKTFNPNK